MKRNFRCTSAPFANMYSLFMRYEKRFILRRCVKSVPLNAFFSIFRTALHFSLISLLFAAPLRPCLVPVCVCMCVCMTYSRRAAKLAQLKMQNATSEKCRESDERCRLKSLPAKFSLFSSLLTRHFVFRIPAPSYFQPFFSRSNV